MPTAKTSNADLLPPWTLYERIYRQIRDQFDNFRKGQTWEGLVVFVGNGLTRIAAAQSEEEDLSWRQWMDRCIESVHTGARGRPMPTLDYYGPSVGNRFPLGG